MQQQYIERVVDLTEPEANQIYRLSVEEAREIVLHGSAEAVGRIAGSFALVAREGKTVKMARSLDRPVALLSGQAPGRSGADCRVRASIRFTTG